eukprot:11194336-Alexandrium_andersonii.AAC.1
MSLRFCAPASQSISKPVDHSVNQSVSQVGQSFSQPVNQSISQAVSIYHVSHCLSRCVLSHRGHNDGNGAG